MFQKTNSGREFNVTGMNMTVRLENDEPVLLVSIANYPTIRLSLMINKDRIEGVKTLDHCNRFELSMALLNVDMRESDIVQAVKDEQTDALLAIFF